MLSPTLKRWLARNIAGATRVELTHRGAEDSDRIVRSWDLGDCSSDTLDDLCPDLLATAQDETDIAGARCSFIVRTIGGGDAERVIGSMRLRCEYVEGQIDPPAEASKEAWLAQAMQQVGRAFNALEAAPKRQREIYDGLVDTLSRRVRELETREKELLAMLRTADRDEAAAIATAEVEAVQRAAILDTVVSEGIGLVKLIAAKNGINMPPPGSGSNGSGGH